LQVLKVYREYRVSKASKEYLVRQVLKAFRENKGFREKKATQER
jgi:hypothetical protein